MNRGCDKMIVLGRLCGDALFFFALFAERSMPVPYIGDPGIKISDPHPGPTTRVLLDCRQVPCPTVCPRRLAAENDPWRFRQQSSRVISIQFWYLTSLVTSLSVGSDPDVSQWLFCKTCIFRRIFSGLGWLLLSWEPFVYLYIGITSLYLYNSIRFGLLQDGIFHKSTAKLVCKTQIHEFFPISR